MRYPDCDRTAYFQLAYNFIEHWQWLMLDQSEPAKEAAARFISFEAFEEPAQRAAAIDWLASNGIDWTLYDHEPVPYEEWERYWEL